LLHKVLWAHTFVLPNRRDHAATVALYEVIGVYARFARHLVTPKGDAVPGLDRRIASDALFPVAVTGGANLHFVASAVVNYLRRRF
jgi:hypothetical protein